ncbi:30S ribosome-binding factor RbfA [Pumilibacter intestinalis]|uniref:30S ribosome-binding factor RbfA n=1 Tax=Pumilibacter intestinalis TaxID=2941511 RepID=UPI00203F0D5F|nr:30S ribosome-binding factor RbfA [Pumilibacter intestinalis]
MSYRTERLNSEMRRAISQIISRLKDPRISAMIGVTSVNVAKDLKTAKVRVEIYGDRQSEQVKETFEALCRSAGHIRKELSQEFKDIRTIPELTFIKDNSLQYSAQIDKILEEIKKHDDNRAH